MKEAEALLNGWELVKLSDVGAFKSGSGFPLNAQGKTLGRYPFFKVSDFSNDGNERSLNRANHYIDEDERRRIGARVFPAGTIAFAKIGAAIFLERKRLVDQESCLDNNMAGYILQDDRVSRDLVLANLQRFSLGSLVASTALPAIGSGELNSISFPMPSSSCEQKSVVAALSDADGVVAGLERVIAKKRLIKRGAMQDLLTARRRLPGFSGEWEETRLGQYGKTYSGLAGKSKQDFGVGTDSYIEFLDVINSTAISRGEFPKVRLSAGERQNRVQRNDLLFNGSSETPEEVGLCAAVIADLENTYLNSFCFGYRLFSSDQIDPIFMAALIRSGEGRERIKHLAQGATRYNLSKRALLELALKLPSYAEQKAIAAVLSDMDTEIQTLEARLVKVRAMKEGIMQNLLTGRVRLV